jgi:hypothetical protein
MVRQQHHNSRTRTNLGRQHLQRIDSTVLKNAHGQTVDDGKPSRFMFQQLGFKIFDSLPGLLLFLPKTPHSCSGL